MGKKVAWILSLLLIAAMFLGACTKPTSSTSSTTTANTTTTSVSSASSTPVENSTTPVTNIPPPKLDFTPATYTDATNGFTFQYDANWAQDVSFTKSDTEIAYLSYLNSAPSVVIYKYPATAASTLKDLLTNVIYQNNLPWIDTASTAQNSYGINAQVVTGQETYNGSTVIGFWTYGFQHDGFWWVMVFSQPPGYWNQLYTDETFSTWQFTDISPSNIVSTTIAPTTAVAPTHGQYYIHENFGDPQYGGSWTFATSAAPGEWDPGAQISGLNWMIQCQYMYQANWAVGPQGTGEYPLTTLTTPDGALSGVLASSWEKPDLTHMIWHIRQGVYYAPHSGVQPREVTPQDYIFCLMRTQMLPRSYNYRGANATPDQYWQATIDPKDPWAVDVTLPRPSPFIGDTDICVYMPETVKYSGPNDKVGSLSNWQDETTTSAFMVTDFLKDSSVTAVKNPNYWEKYPLNPKYSLPFVNGWITLIIPDNNTLISAMRAHKIDEITVGADDGIAMRKTNPELNFWIIPTYYNQVIFLQDTKPPFNDINVRKALTIAIDRQGILKDYLRGQGTLLSWPYQPAMGPDIYTPLNQQPADVKELFTYNPTLAKEYLAKAGFPNGFSMTLQCATVYPPNISQMANLVANYWNAIGVKTTVVVKPDAINNSLMYSRSYQDAGIQNWSNNDPTWMFNTAYGTNPSTGTPMLYNYDGITPSRILADNQQIMSTLSEADRDKLMKAEGIWILQQAWDIALPQQESYYFFQPWVKGWVGESGGMYVYGWIDKAIYQQWTGRTIQ